MTMNHSQITDALTAVRTAGYEFTKAFNNLSDVIEAMAQEHTDLIGEVLAKDKMIADRDETISSKQRELDSTYSRAIKAEHDGWEVAQTLARTKEQLELVEATGRTQAGTIADQHRELSDLRPFRSEVDKLNLDLASREDTITSLRSEVSKLLEIILNVATSVDSVVNKPKPDDKPSQTESLVTDNHYPNNFTPTDDHGYPIEKEVSYRRPMAYGHAAE